MFVVVRECGGEDGPVARETQSVQTTEARGDPPQVNPNPNPGQKLEGILLK